MGRKRAGSWTSAEPAGVRARGQTHAVSRHSLSAANEGRRPACCWFPGHGVPLLCRAVTSHGLASIPKPARPTWRERLLVVHLGVQHQLLLPVQQHRTQEVHLLVVGEEEKCIGKNAGIDPPPALSGDGLALVFEASRHVRPALAAGSQTGAGHRLAEGVGAAGWDAAQEAWL
ncbi:hypothetical protein ABPG75_000563 [Micractinium tetrahymenae]